jgi:hypothetical protein
LPLLARKRLARTTPSAGTIRILINARVLVYGDDKVREETPTVEVLAAPGFRVANRNQRPRTGIDNPVAPAQAEAQENTRGLDSRLRGNDGACALDSCLRGNDGDAWPGFPLARE